MELTLDNATQATTREAWDAGDEPYPITVIPAGKVGYHGHLPLGMVIVSHDGVEYIMNAGAAKELR